MTGFGRATVEMPDRKITVEIKSLNSKQLDVSMRVPAIYREKELELRNRIAARLERGKVDVSVYRESTGADEGARINIALMAGYKNQIEEMRRELRLPEPQDWYSLLLRMPEATHTDAVPALADDEALALARVTDSAVEALMDYRRAEGEKLESFFTVRINRIAELLAQVPQFEAERIAKIKARITENLSKISVTEYDHGRLEQEMIFYIEKLDINEEKQRLSQHLRYFMETMEGPHGQGKKLGFISQEMGREINTLGSKSNHADLQRIVVKMKDELEQIKEQVLNVM